MISLPAYKIFFTGNPPYRFIFSALSIGKERRPAASALGCTAGTSTNIKASAKKVRAKEKIRRLSSLSPPRSGDASGRRRNPSRSTAGAKAAGPRGGKAEGSNERLRRGEQRSILQRPHRGPHQRGDTKAGPNAAPKSISSGADPGKQGKEPPQVPVPQQTKRQVRRSPVDLLFFVPQRSFPKRAPIPCGPFRYRAAGWNVRTGRRRHE